jgi:acyl carrier protein
VLTLQADVANETQMRCARDLVFEHFGALQGVIHAAGVPGGGVIQLKTRAAGESVLKPKVHGTRVLESVMKDVSLDFLVLCSSIEATMGNVGQVDYCAANAFLDAFAHASSRDEGRVTVSVNWDVWGEVGMAIETALNYTSTSSNQTLVDSGAGPNQRDLSNAILPGEGVQVFERILAHNTLPQVAVCTQHLPTLVQQAKQITQAQLLEGTARAQASLKTYPRPALASDYVAPRNEIEATIAVIWGELLGIAPVGIHDNFFELGGHSLLATQVISRVRVAFRVEIPLHELFAMPTIAGMAAHIKEAQKVVRALQTPLSATDEVREEGEL